MILFQRTGVLFLITHITQVTATATLTPGDPSPGLSKHSFIYAYSTDADEYLFNGSVLKLSHLTNRESEARTDG